MTDKIETDSLNIPVSSTTYYFPISMFNNNSHRNIKLSKYLDIWYSRMLFALNEPLLYNSTEDKEVYRFTWLRRFRNPVSIRIEKINNSVKLFVKISDGTGGSSPGKIVTDQVRELNADQWNMFKTKLNDIHFWKLPVEEYKDLDTDNSEWILEGSTKDSYHFITRTSPYEYNLKLFRDCCEYLISLSDVNSIKNNVR